MRAFVFVLLLAFSAGTAYGAAHGSASSWPMGGITVTLPASKGSESAVYFMLLGEPFTAQTGKKLSAQYVPAQAGGEAWARMADDPPDGSVLTNVLLPNLILRTYQVDSGVYPANMDICHIGAYAPCVLWVPDSSPLDSVKTLLAMIRHSPGYFMIAGPGRFSSGQVASRTFDRLHGVKTTYIPYAGTVEAARAVLKGEASAFWGYSVPPAVPDASFRALAVAAESRLASMPETPTFRELGAELVEGVYLGIAVPVAVPEFYRERISRVFSAIAREPSYLARAAEAGFIPLDIGRSEAGTLYKQLEELVGNRVDDYALTEQ